MLVFKLEPGQRASREDVAAIVADLFQRDQQWASDRITPNIDSALENGSLVEDANGMLQTSSAAMTWTLFQEPPDEESDET